MKFVVQYRAAAGSEPWSDLSEVGDFDDLGDAMEKVNSIHKLAKDRVEPYFNAMDVRIVKQQVMWSTVL